ncbi:MAG TPA: hypothetical protein V6D35_12810 [Candidatus Sericytochromatia bacterium]
MHEEVSRLGKSSVRSAIWLVKGGFRGAIGARGAGDRLGVILGLGRRAIAPPLKPTCLCLVRYPESDSKLQQLLVNSQGITPLNLNNATSS